MKERIETQSQAASSMRHNGCEYNHKTQHMDSCFALIGFHLLNRLSNRSPNRANVLPLVVLSLNPSCFYTFYNMPRLQSLIDTTAEQYSDSHWFPTGPHESRKERADNA